MRGQIIENGDFARCNVAVGGVKKFDFSEKSNFWTGQLYRAWSYAAPSLRRKASGDMPASRRKTRLK